MALLPVAQAVTIGMEAPWKSYLMAMRPPAMLMIIPGTKKGETRRGPFSISTCCSLAKVPIPPMPDPT